ncbi:hypothetical protein HZI73_05835 [Vallitalea pronyensis]|uniref:Erythromycin biosynthesis protein CIII-like C-terminal domain-containing protein n=1 Tax=Vallitalea pronyensis TaxID=1348613 RepID=A0A8J8MI34_9FIRM|nr:glycosyltransferase [Vallitalea pronyensis]QUI21847.1 hypothetical protein HZI73_05835 [Vallitalea pronyensis]
MSTVVFFGYPFDGHIFPTLGLIKELVARGLKVFYYASSPYKKVIEEAGATCCYYKARFRFKKYKEDTDQPLKQKTFLQEYAFQQNNFLKLYDINKRVIAYHEHEIMALEPDIIIHDTLCVWGKLLAHKMGIPSIASHVDFIYTQALRRFDLWHILKEKLNLVDDELSKYQAKFLKFFEGDLHKLAIEGMTIDDFLKLFYSDYLNITYLPLAFQPHSDKLDKKLYQFIGYEKDKRKQNIRFPFKKLGNKPIIYISMGSTHWKQCLHFYEVCIHTFKQNNHSVVISTCNRQIYQKLKSTKIPSHFTIKNYVPQIELLKRAGVYICHGGLSSIRESVSYQVPLIIIPTSFDQVIAAQQVEKFGIGIYIKSFDISSNELKAHIKLAYCNKQMIRNSKELNQLFMDAGGSSKAADHILNIKNLMS